jgi:hypothetical protein
VPVLGLAVVLLPLSDCSLIINRFSFGFPYERKHLSGFILSVIFLCRQECHFTYMNGKVTTTIKSEMVM